MAPRKALPKPSKDQKYAMRKAARTKAARRFPYCRPIFDPDAPTQGPWNVKP